jgi:uncharacterized protein
MRNEIKRGQKIYFWDTGIRNGLLKNVQPLELRRDTGAQRENFVISERMKYLQNHRIHYNSYFWRTHSGQEIDYIETNHGDFFHAYEVKWSIKAKAKIPFLFKETYPQAQYHVVSRDNYMKFVT